MLYKELVGFIPDAIVLMQGGIIKEQGSDGIIRYRSTKINEGDAFGILWGEARVLAAAELVKSFLNTTIILTSVSAIYEELKQAETPNDRIILEKKSKNTLSQIKAALKIIYKNKFNSIIFITSEYHIPRLKTLYENVAQKDKRPKIKVKFIPAETILAHVDKRYIKIIEKVKKSPAYLKRLQNEKIGLSMIENHEYGKEGTMPINKLERVI